MFDKVESWMVTVGLAIAGAVGWGYRETQINKTQANQIDDNRNEIRENRSEIKRLKEKSAERGEVMARIDERQASIASDIADIKKAILK